MSLVELNLRCAGVVLVGLGAAHAYFPRRFGWPAETRALSLLTRQVFEVHNAFIGFTVLLQGLLAVGLADELVRPSRLAGYVTAGLTLFWGARLVTQFAVYKAELWKGKRFETAVHVVFALMWLYFTATFGVVAWRQLAP